MTDVFRVIEREACLGERAAALSADMHRLFLSKEVAEIKRIEAMLSLFESGTCLSHRLAQYFADAHSPTECGHCSVCRGNVVVLPNAAVLEPIGEEMILGLTTPLIDAAFKQGISLSPEAITRFLCGIATPLTGRLRAGKMEGFGKFACHPFAEVKNKVLAANCVKDA